MSVFYRVILLCLTSFVLLCPAAYSGDDQPRLMEIETGERSWVGRLLARSEEAAWLLDRYGELVQLPAEEITHIEVAGPVFRPAPVEEHMRRLRGELPRGYKVAATRHFLIAAAEERFSTFRDLLERVYGEVTRFYDSRDLTIAPPALPLTVIVFGSEAEFRAYCRQDNTRWSNDLRGYYSLRTNRVALLDDRKAGLSEFEMPQLRTAKTTAVDETSARLISGALSSRTADTIVHEITHQIGFNAGIHSRFGQSPQWLIEGLAMHLESSTIRTRSHGRPMKPGEQINPERLRWFMEEYSERYAAGDIASLVASDQLFERSTFDAYSLSWGLACFLSTGGTKDENSRFFDYLKKIASRGPFEPYLAQERLEDFRQAFGDPGEVERRLHRFLEEMSAQNQ